MEHPEFEVIENDDEISIHFRRITPIYPATEGLSQRVLRGLIYRALENLDGSSIETLLPRDVDLGERTRRACVKFIFRNARQISNRLASIWFYSEFFAMQMLIASRRSSAASRSGQAHCGSGALLEKFLRALPFDLTDAQMRVIDELRRDLASSRADEPFAPRRCWFRQNRRCYRGDVACRRSWLPDRTHGADANSGRAALRRSLSLA